MSAFKARATAAEAGMEEGKRRAGVLPIREVRLATSSLTSSGQVNPPLFDLALYVRLDPLMRQWNDSSHQGCGDRPSQLVGPGGFVANVRHIYAMIREAQQAVRMRQIAQGRTGVACTFI